MILLYALVGSLAQLVDGSIGMGFGLTSATLLSLGGTAPVAASAAIHAAKIGTAISSGAAHWRLGNVDPRLTLRVGIPGALGALLGATLLSHVHLDMARPLTSTILVALGAYILVRGARRRPTLPVRPARSWFHPLLGLGAGTLDATGGGGWGPVVAPTLLLQGEPPRRVVGSVSMSELLVAVFATVGFIINVGSIDWRTAAALMLGGVATAPLAARISTRIEPGRFTRLIGAGVLIINAASLVAAGMPILALSVVLAVLLVMSAREYTRQRRSIGTAARQPLDRFNVPTPKQHP